MRVVSLFSSKPQQENESTYFPKCRAISLEHFHFARSIHCSWIAYPEATLEALADHVEGDWVDAGVDRCHVDADVVQHQKETKRVTETHQSPMSSFLVGDSVFFKKMISSTLASILLFLVHYGSCISFHTWAVHSGLGLSHRRWSASGYGWGGEAASIEQRPEPDRILS